MGTVVDVGVFLARRTADQPLSADEFCDMERNVSGALRALARAGELHIFGSEQLTACWRGFAVLDLAQTHASGRVLVCSELAGSLAAAAEAAPGAAVLTRLELPADLEERRFSSWRFDRGRLRLVRDRPGRRPVSSPVVPAGRETDWTDFPWPSEPPPSVGDFEAAARSAYDTEEPLAELRARAAALRTPPSERPAGPPGGGFATCKECGYAFALSEGERDWYKRKNLKIPVRCGVCRRRARSKCPVTD